MAGSEVLHDVGPRTLRCAAAFLIEIWVLEGGESFD